MARVQLVDQFRKINMTKQFRPPKKVGDLDAWYKAARKAIPQIPDIKNSDWFPYQQGASLDRIAYELHNPIGERCYVTIERTSAWSM